MEWAIAINISPLDPQNPPNPNPILLNNPNPGRTHSSCSDRHRLGCQRSTKIEKYIVRLVVFNIFKLQYLLRVMRVLVVVLEHERVADYHVKIFVAVIDHMPHRFLQQAYHAEQTTLEERRHAWQLARWCVSPVEHQNYEYEMIYKIQF